MKRHSMDQTAEWAKSWGLKGFEQMYPENREKQRMFAIRQWNEKNRDKNEQTNNSGRRSS